MANYHNPVWHVEKGSLTQAWKHYAGRAAWANNQKTERRLRPANEDNMRQWKTFVWRERARKRQRLGFPAKGNIKAHCFHLQGLVMTRTRPHKAQSMRENARPRLSRINRAITFIGNRWSLDGNSTEIFQVWKATRCLVWCFISAWAVFPYLLYFTWVLNLSQWLREWVHTGEVR